MASKKRLHILVVPRSVLVVKQDDISLAMYPKNIIQMEPMRLSLSYYAKHCIHNHDDIRVSTKRKK